MHFSNMFNKRATTQNNRLGKNHLDKGTSYFKQ